MKIHGNYFGAFFATGGTQNLNHFILHKILVLD